MSLQVAKLDACMRPLFANLVTHGDEGSGKSTLMNELCHQFDIQKQFKDGFLFVQLGENPDTCA